MQKRSSHNQHQHQHQHQHHVAIIGGGYAGLSLAVALHQLSNSNCCKVTIFDSSSSSSSSSYVVGNIQVPYAPTFMKQVELQPQWKHNFGRNGSNDCQQQNQYNNSNEKTIETQILQSDQQSKRQDYLEATSTLISRQAFTSFLLQHIGTATIHYGQRIVSTTSTPAAATTTTNTTTLNNTNHTNHRSDYYCINSEATQYGPFHTIIYANGVRSSFRNLHALPPSCTAHTTHTTHNTCQLAFIGDARWVLDRWWDFGTRRIQSGANIAMKDALQLAKLILSKINNHHHHHQNSTNANTSHNNHIHNHNDNHYTHYHEDWAKFCAANIATKASYRQWKNRSISFVILLLALGWHFHEEFFAVYHFLK